MKLYTKEQLKFVVAFAGTNDTRHTLNGVFFEGDRVVATDGAILGIVPEQTEVDVNDFPAVEGITSKATKEPAPYIMPRESVLKIIQAIPRRSKTMPILAHAAIVKTESGIKAVTTDIETPQVQVIRPIIGTFPQYKNVLPQDGEIAYKFCVNIKLLKRLVTAYESLGEEHVLFGVQHDGYSPVSVNGESTGATAIIMPCRSKSLVGVQSGYTLQKDLASSEIEPTPETANA